MALLLSRSGLGQTNLGIVAWLTNNNTLKISITNAIPGATYDLFSVPQLTTGALAWTVFQTGTPGQVTFSIPTWPALSGFFVVGTNDLDFDGWPNFDDGNSANTNIHALTIYIESPTNGAVIY
jgi:hypothetical protein